MSAKFDIEALEVIFVVAGDRIKNIPTIISSLVNYLGCKQFAVICPSRDIEYARETLHGIKCNIIDENIILPDCNVRVIAERIPILFPKNTPYNYAAWYYQQFLKMAFSLRGSPSDFYLILDADTVILRKMDLFARNAALLTKGREYHRPYFDTIQNLFDGRVERQLSSHISQHMLVNKADMRAMLDELEVNGLKWWEYILSNLNTYDLQQFSEYETYSSYCLSKWPERYRSIERSWFRYGRSFLLKDMKDSDLSSLAKFYDFIAFEEWDVGIRNWIRSWIVFLGDRVKSLIMHIRF
jgi:hypothetical protein